MGANEKHAAAYHGADQRDRAFGKAPADRTESDQDPKKPAELGPVGRWALGIVSLAIVTPFIGILWAWAAGVVRSLGGLW